MKLASTCSIAGLQPETAIGMVIVNGTFQAEGLDGITITSCTDGKHSIGSLHYVGYAFDIRTKDYEDGLVNKVALKCRTALGAEWDVVIEKTHLHVEYQPKANRRVGV